MVSRRRTKEEISVVVRRLNNHRPRHSSNTANVSPHVRTAVQDSERRISWKRAIYKLSDSWRIKYFFNITYLKPHNESCVKKRGEITFLNLLAANCPPKALVVPPKMPDDAIARPKISSFTVIWTCRSPLRSEQVILTMSSSEHLTVN